VSYWTRVYSDPRDAEIMERWNSKQFLGRQEFSILLVDETELQVVAEELKVGAAGELEIWSRRYGRQLRPGETVAKDPEDWWVNYEDPIGAPYLSMMLAAGEWRRWSFGTGGLDTTPVVWWTGWDEDQKQPVASVGKPPAAPVSATATPKKVGRRPISWATRQFVKERDAYRCRNCGTHMNLTVDHIVPVSGGGTNDAENLQTLCQSCNSAKGGAKP